MLKSPPPQFAEGRRLAAQLLNAEAGRVDADYIPPTLGTMLANESAPHGLTLNDHVRHLTETANPADASAMPMLTEADGCINQLAREGEMSRRPGHYVR